MQLKNKNYDREDKINLVDLINLLFVCQRK